MLKLSDSALGAVMLALQKSLMEQSDITETLRNFELVVDSNEELVITNPPVIEVDKEDA